MQFEFKPASVRDAAQGFAAMWTTAAQTYEPALKSVARSNMELMTLANRRAQAAMDLPAKLAACKSPVEVVNAQFDFWQTAAKQYAEASTRYWDNMRGMAGQNAGWNPMAMFGQPPKADDNEKRRPTSRDGARYDASDDRRAA
jgi:hypothetical protein